MGPGVRTALAPGSGRVAEGGWGWDTPSSGCRFHGDVRQMPTRQCWAKALGVQTGTGREERHGNVSLLCVIASF